jgi:hypothetical protein
MFRRFLRCLAPCLLVLSLESSSLHAQPPSAPEAEKSEKSTPVFPYFLMILYSLLILTIVCMPSRKA